MVEEVYLGLRNTVKGTTAFMAIKRVAGASAMLQRLVQSKTFVLGMEIKQTRNVHCTFIEAKRTCGACH